MESNVPVMYLAALLTIDEIGAPRRVRHSQRQYMYATGSKVEVFLATGFPF